MAVSPYDIKINSVGYMVDTQNGGPVTPTDLQPGTARAADGEADFISFTADASHQLTDFSGGAGQRRHVSTNRWLTGLGNGIFGPFFPPYKQLNAASTGGTTSWYTRIGSTLYGKTSTQFKQIESATTIASTGTPDQAPVQTASGAIYFSTGGTLKRVTTSGQTWARGSGGSDADLLPTDFSVNGVAAFGRHLFAFAQRTFSTTPAVRQSAQFAWANDQHLGMKWDQPTIPGNVLLACFISATSDDGGVTPTDPAWEEIVNLDVATSRTDFCQVFIIKDNDSFRAAGEVFQSTQNTDLTAVGFLVEVEGVHDGKYPDVIYDLNSSTADTTTTVSTGTAENGGLTIAFLGWMDDTSDSGAIPTETGWTEHEDIGADNDGAAPWVRGSIQSDDTGTSVSVTLSTAADKTFGVLVSFTDYSNAVTKDVILATADDGESWVLIRAYFSSSVIGTPRAFAPWDGYLWFTTQYGMYRMRYGEDEFLSGEQKINIAIEQVAEFRDYPSADNTGKWLVVYENGLYTGVGEALLRYTQGGGLESVFPTPDWATVGGQIRAIVRAGRMMFFGAGDYLWLTDGRSFHPVADPAASTDMDYMAFHNGKLYLNDDPSTYYNVGNPSLRPDLNDATAASFTTGYYISSLLDFHKVPVPKIISHFEDQVRFTQTTNTGTVTWAYRTADGDAADPGKAGGGDTGSTWTTITTHAKGDTSPKHTDLSTEIEAHAIWLRATLTPGTSGYPYIEWASPIGRAIPETQRRFTIPLKVAVGLRDREGTQLYVDQAAVNTVIDNLYALRDPFQSPTAVDLLFEDESAAGETVRGTVVAVTPRRMPSRGDEGAYWRIDVTFDELP